MRQQASQPTARPIPVIPDHAGDPLNTATAEHLEIRSPNAEILADEPAGNLDSTGTEVLDLITRLHQNGKTIVLVTHDDKVASRADRVVRMKDGRVDQDVSNRQPPELPAHSAP